MIKKYYVLYGNSLLLLRYEITVGEGALKLKDVIRHVITLIQVS